MPRENVDLLGAIAELERERGIDRETLIEAVEAALISAYRRNYEGAGQNVGVRVDRGTGGIDVYVSKTVSEPVQDEAVEIGVEDAKAIDPTYEVGDVIEFPVPVRDFGRIAAQTAKQVVVQRIREAERGMIYDEYAQREGDVVTGIVQRVQGRNVYVDLGRTEALLLPSEQIPGEYPATGDRLKLFMVEVKKTSKGPQVMVSRTHPGLLKRLFELEVPEIHDGLVEVKGIAREAGARSKLAVHSRDGNVDPVGACVGHKGMRVQSVVNELRGEKVDIIKWSADAGEYVANALSPAKASRVVIEEADKVARVIVPDYQLSLAIGRAGQNARLAAKLTGWRIDIRSESQIADDGGAQRPAAGAGTSLPPWAPPWAGGLTADESRAPMPAPWEVAAGEPRPLAGSDGETAVPPAAAEFAEPGVGAEAPPRRKATRRTVVRKKEPTVETKPVHRGAGRSLMDALAEVGLVEDGAESGSAAPAPAVAPPEGALIDPEPPGRRRKKQAILDDEPATAEPAEGDAFEAEVEAQSKPKRRPRKVTASPDPEAGEEA